MAGEIWFSETIEEKGTISILFISLHESVKEQVKATLRPAKNS